MYAEDHSTRCCQHQPKKHRHYDVNIFLHQINTCKVIRIHIYIYIVFNNLFILYIIYVYRYIINRSYTHIHVYSKTYIILYSNFFLQEPSFVGCHQVPWIIRKMCSSSTPWEGDGWVPLVEGIVFFFTGKTLDG
jgi:hypothetical protein